MAYRRFQGPGRNVYCVPEYQRECVQQSLQKPRATLAGRTSKYPIFSPEYLVLSPVCRQKYLILSPVCRQKYLILLQCPEVYDFVVSFPPMRELCWC